MSRAEMRHGLRRGGCRLAIRPAPRLPRSISRQTTFHHLTTDEREIRGMIFYLLDGPCGPRGSWACWPARWA